MIDLTGEKFGKLTVLKRLHYSQSGHSYFWECECDCGNKIIVLGSNLKRKHTQSCGCYNKESLKQRTEDLMGQKYGRLTVLKRMENDKWGQSCWLCLCECGNTIMVTRGRLKNGHTTSCGCIRTQRTSNLNKTHGLCCTRLYRIWCGMKSRCYNSKEKIYKYYGGRGITICDEWKNNFETFYNWAMNNGYKQDLSIDRINNDGNYAPNNCRWATKKEQANNRSSNVNKKGEKHTISEWGEITGIGRKNISNRINNKGWSIEKALTTPVERQVKNGK